MQEIFGPKAVLSNYSQLWSGLLN